MIMSPGLKIGNRGREKSGTQIINSLGMLRSVLEISAVKEV